MDGKALTQQIENQDWLEPVADTLQGAVGAAFAAAGPAGKPIENALNGVWLGHALHPVVTDVPIGAWTVSAVLDGIEAVTGRADLAPGADAAVAIGLAGALASAVTGLVQWYPLKEKSTKRLGAAHAILNIGATALFTASYALRQTGRDRSLARALGWLGYGVVSAGAYLGGELVSDKGISVDHAPRKNLPVEFVPVISDTELAEEKPTAATAGEVPIVLVRKGEQIFALANACSHLGGPLAEGKLSDGCISCPWHGSRFRLADGAVEDGPATFAQPTFETRVRDGKIEVRANPELPQNHA